MVSSEAKLLRHTLYGMSASVTFVFPSFLRALRAELQQNADTHRVQVRIQTLSFCYARMDICAVDSPQ